MLLCMQCCTIAIAMVYTGPRGHLVAGVRAVPLVAADDLEWVRGVGQDVVLRVRAALRGGGFSLV